MIFPPSKKLLKCYFLSNCSTPSCNSDQQTSMWPFSNVIVIIWLQALACEHIDLLKKIWQYTMCWITEISSALPYVLNTQQTNFSYQYFVRIVWVWIVSIKLFFYWKKKKQETSNKICKCSQGQGSTPTMQRIPEAKPLILIWTIIWNLTDLTREVKRSMFSLLVLESIVLGSSNRLTWIPPLYFHLKLSFM